MFFRGTHTACQKNAKALPTGGVCSFKGSFTTWRKKMAKQNGTPKQAGAVHIPLKSEHGGSFTKDSSGQDDDQKGFSFDPLREVEEASRALGGHWRIESTHEGEARMTRVTG